jgi:hypothetical protein
MQGSGERNINHTNRSQQRMLILYGLLGVLEGLGTLVYLVAIPSDSKNILFLGFSASRLGMMIGVLIVAGILAFFTYRCYRKEDFLNYISDKLLQQNVVYLPIFTFASMLGMAGWIGLLLPDYRILPEYLAYYERLYPLILWGALLGMQTVILLPLIRYGTNWRDLKAQKSIFLVSLLFLAIFLLVGFFSIITGIGIKPDPAGWVHPGIPLTGMQLFLVMMTGALLAILSQYLPGKFSQPARRTLFGIDWFDGLICLILWIVAAVLWLQAPLEAGYFNPAPVPPNNEVYPYSDSATYDQIARGILLGNGFANGRVVPRPLYILFLTVLHAIVGNSYNSVVALQVVVLAVFPALLYLMGKVYQGRLLGLMAAALGILREINSIAATPYVRVSHSRLLLSDLPTAICVIIFTMLIVKWFRDQESRRILPLAAGGALGLLMLMRTQAIMFLPFILLGAFFIPKQRFRRWLGNGLLFAVGVILSVAPWLMRNYHFTGQWVFDSPAQTSWVTERYNLDYMGEGEEASQITSPMQVIIQNPGNVARFVTAHFINNALGTVLMLPTYFRLDDLQHILLTSTPFWMDWGSGILLADHYLLVVNLILISIGIGLSWKRWRIAGLVPLIVYAAYDLSNAVARNSGWRYMLPVDWVGYFYYCLGWLQFVLWLGMLIGIRLNLFATQIDEYSSADLQARVKCPWQRLVAWGAFFVFAGALLPLSEVIFPKKYPEMSKDQVLSLTVETGSLSEDQKEISSLKNLLKDERSIALVGEAFYPRFYYSGQGQPASYSSAYGYRQYNRLGFVHVGWRYSEVLLPLAEPPAYFPDANEVIVIGCREKDYISAYLVIVKGKKEVVYRRSPAIPAACPLAEPE